MRRGIIRVLAVLFLAALALMVWSYLLPLIRERATPGEGELELATCPTPWPECGYLPLILHQYPAPPVPTPTFTPAPTLTPTPAFTPGPVPSAPFYGVEFAPAGDLGTVKDLGAEVVLWSFDYNGTPQDWLAYLDQANGYGLKVVAWLWPQGWNWNGSEWEIDQQARSFVQTVAGHPALFAVYALHEPYWMGCYGCGYTTAEQQALYNAIKEIADVPIWSDIGGIAFWTEYSEATAFADGVCDYCAVWYYPFLPGGVYQRDQMISTLEADIAVAKERAPNSKLFYGMQSFAQAGDYRMPTAEEMVDMASIVYSKDIEGALWYVWWFGPLYEDFLSNHPELYPVVREIYDEIVLPKKQ